MAPTSGADRWRAGLVWFGLVFLVFNAGLDHRECSRFVAEVKQGAVAVTPGNLVRALRAYLTDDDDPLRYQAYANAALGLPYRAYYVRSLDGWLAAFARPAGAPDPDATPEVAPPRPLTPYRDFAVEYPPGFFLLALPLARLAADGDAFRVLLGVAMALALTLALLVGARLGRHLPEPVPGRRLVAWTAGATAALGVVATHRYDAAIALLVVAAAWACLARRPALVGLLLGAAVAGKLVPLVLAPLFLLYWIRRGRVGELAVAALALPLTVAVIALPAVTRAGGHVLDLVRYHGARPLQVESTAGALLSLLHASFGVPLAVVRSFGSTNLQGPLVPSLGAVAGPLSLLGLLAVYGLTWVRLGRAERSLARQNLVLLEGLAAALVAWMVLGKVFSPQYLVWLLPLGLLVSLARPDRSRWLLLGAMGLTQLVYPIGYEALTGLAPWAAALVLARNLLLGYWALAPLVRSA